MWPTCVTWQMSSLLVCCVTLSYLTDSCKAVKIENLRVPKVVKANKTDVILDCAYTMEEWEKHDGLVIKWYINDVHLVYQWIPPRAPQVLGHLKGRVDTTYRISKDPWQQHRALKIKYPDPGLSGSYRCIVATFEGEDTDSAPMLVFAPPSHVRLFYWRPSEYLVNITCTAYDVSPIPHFDLYIIDPNRTRHKIHTRGINSHKANNTWITSTWGLAVYSDTQEESIVGCTIRIPGTPHVETRETLYHSDLQIITTTTTTTTTSTSPPTLAPEDKPIQSPNMSNSVPATRPSLFDAFSLLSLSSCCAPTWPKTFYLNCLLLLHIGLHRWLRRRL